jgi:starvation-inducible DNA-binding protein
LIFGAYFCIVNIKEMKNYIGLDKTKADALSIMLDDLLINYQIYYQNLRGFHWNIKGKEFFELHAKFEEFYNDARLKIDEIAERVLTLGHTPSHTMSTYVSRAEVKEANNISNGREAVEITATNISTLVQKERAILAQAADADDEGTVTLMSDYITQQEKVLWMLKAYLGS